MKILSYFVQNNNTYKYYNTVELSLRLLKSLSVSDLLSLEKAKSQDILYIFNSLIDFSDTSCEFICIIVSYICRSSYYKHYFLENKSLLLSITCKFLMNKNKYLDSVLLKVLVLCSLDDKYKFNENNLYKILIDSNNNKTTIDNTNIKTRYNQDNYIKLLIKKLEALSRIGNSIEQINSINLLALIYLNESSIINQLKTSKNECDINNLCLNIYNYKINYLLSKLSNFLQLESTKNLINDAKYLIENKLNNISDYDFNINFYKLKTKILLIKQKDQICCILASILSINKEFQIVFYNMDKIKVLLEELYSLYTETELKEYENNMKNLKHNKEKKYSDLSVDKEYLIFITNNEKHILNNKEHNNIKRNILQFKTEYLQKTKNNLINYKYFHYIYNDNLDINNKKSSNQIISYNDYYFSNCNKENNYDNSLVYTAFKTVITDYRNSILNLLNNTCSSFEESRKFILNSKATNIILNSLYNEENSCFLELLLSLSRSSSIVRKDLISYDVTGLLIKHIINGSCSDANLKKSKITALNTLGNFFYDSSIEEPEINYCIDKLAKIYLSLKDSKNNSNSNLLNLNNSKSKVDLDSSIIFKNECEYNSNDLKFNIIFTIKNVLYQFSDKKEIKIAVLKKMPVDIYLNLLDSNNLELIEQIVIILRSILHTSSPFDDFLHGNKSTTLLKKIVDKLKYIIDSLNKANIDENYKVIKFNIAVQILYSIENFILIGDKFKSKVEESGLLNMIGNILVNLNKY